MTESDIFVPPDASASSQDLEVLASNIFQWLLGSSTADSKPLDDLDAAYAGGMVCASEVLAIYSFAVLSAQIEPKLNERLGVLKNVANVANDFIPFPNGIAGIADGNFKNLSAAKILLSPGAEIGSAVTDAVISYLLKKRLHPRRRFNGLNVSLFQHPADRALQNTIKAIPGVDALMGKLVEQHARNEEIGLRGRAIEIRPDGTLKSVYGCFREACEVLGISPLPHLFVEQGPVNARSIGVNNPSVVVSSMALSFLTHDELLFIFGRELGRIKAGHLRYLAACELIRNGANLASAVTLGISSLLTDSTITPLMAAWARRAELTADRAGFLTCQDREVALRAILKMSGYPPVSYRNLHSRTIVEQADELRKMLASSFRNRFYKISQLWVAQQPFPILRAYELLEWLFDGFPMEILIMNDTQIQKYQGWHADDPLQVEFVYRLIQIASQWAAERYRLNLRNCRKVIRRMLLEEKQPKGTELAHLLQIGFSIEKHGADSFSCNLVVLVNEREKAVRVRVPVPAPESWDELPAQYRKDFIRNGEKVQQYSLYSA